MRKSKRIISLLLTAIMVATTFVVAIPTLLVDVDAATTIDGVTQERVVGTDGSYATTYDNYAAEYLNGASDPTNIVIPGLNAEQDYVIQGVTYYPARDWMLVTAYHNYDSDSDAEQFSSKLFALNAATGEFEAMFSFINVDGTVNTDHGGGIAVSENNIYYSCGDTDRKIAYAPVSALESAPVGQHTQIQLVAEKDFVEIGSVTYDSKTAYSAYVCYDQGVLWVGNFYDLGAKLLGVTIAADGYNAPSNNSYNSMVFGYELSGDSSAEEWANLTSGTSDCQGSPSYALGLDNNLKDVQYAVVDNGKLYLSRSYGSGAGNSVSFGFGDSSFLTIADIDLSQPGTIPVTISTTGTDSLDKTIMAHDISTYKDYPMMPMSEGFCVVNDQLFITFEGASNKYLNESSGTFSIGNCEKPVDVIWRLDPYELMEITVAEPEQSIYYEKVTNYSEIVSGEEYIIVHESDNKDPVTQKNYLYALNADGNFNGYKLSKSTTDIIRGYNGMVGHPISHYTIETNASTGKTVLYLEEPETDDIENIRWSLTKNNDGSVSFKTTETYFANTDCLYFDGSLISMAPSNANALSNIGIMEAGDGNGGFWLHNASSYFLWCNDGTNADYNAKANSYYESNKGTISMYDGLKEVAGTFHCDALNSTGSNILGGAIATGADSYYEDGLFNIYKRVVDSASSTYESRVYTDLQAELQEDGSYDVVLETYAISPNHYQYRGDVPTDYIIVADTSSSMAEKGSTGVQSFSSTDTLTVESLSVEANTSDDNGTGVSGYGFTNPDEDIYLQHTDGKYYKVYMAVNTTELKKVIGIITTMRQKYYAYYIADDGLYYCIEDHAVNYTGRTYTEWKAWVDSGENESDYSTKTSNSNRRSEDVYVGVHYRFDDINSSYTDEHVRLDTLKTAATNLVDEIVAQNSRNRIAFVQYGADDSTGFITTSGDISTTAYTSGFFGSSTYDKLKTYISAITTSEQTNNSGVEMSYANDLLDNSGYSYKTESSTRNAAIILLSDGIPGADANGATETAANAVIAQALNAKNRGAFVYTVLIGNNEVSGFNKKAYMDGVSSKYAAAYSLDNLGGQSVDGVNYAISLASTTMNNFVDFGALTTEEVASNSAVGLENLDANSYLRQRLNDAFKFPSDFDVSADVSVELITGEYDEVGRFTFKDSETDIAANATDATNIKAKTIVNKDTKTLTVTNYDYGKEYIAKNKETDGRKLRVTLKGLLADETQKIRNTSINNVDETGIYKTKDNMDNSIEFKMLPTAYFNIPEYTYVLDYGLQMYDSDVNGTLRSVSADLSAQRDSSGNLAYKLESENGLVQITNNNLDLIYETTPTNPSDSGYCLIQRDDGTYDWFEIKVVPATNVLYEETWAEDGTANSVAWSAEGTALALQQTITNSDTDVYGYDDNYVKANNAHSNGTVAKTSVSSTAKKSAVKSFQFLGKGIDIISACGANTGIMAVSVKDSDGNLVKGYLIDTYYSGDYVNSDGLACQVPVAQFSGDHDTYTVEITALYLSSASALQKSITGTNLANGKLSATTGTAVDAATLLAEVGLTELADAELELVWFDSNSVLNGGTGAKGNVKTNRAGETTTTLDCYLDGFRIYHPMNNADENYIESEQQAQYINVINSLANNQIGTGTTAIDGIAYVTGTLQPDAETGETPALSFANYQSVGPQNELYLNGSASEALVLMVGNVSATSRVMLGLRAVTGTATVTIGSGDQAKAFDINSATEMYYDITDCIVLDSDGNATITIQNTGSGVLAVNNMKLTGNTTMTSVVGEDALEYAAAAMSAPVQRAEVINGVVTPVTEDDTTNENSGDSTTDNNVTDGSGSFIEQLIAMLIELIKSLFNFMPVGEVM